MELNDILLDEIGPLCTGFQLLQPTNKSTIKTMLEVGVVGEIVAASARGKKVLSHGSDSSSAITN